MIRFKKKRKTGTKKLKKKKRFMLSSASVDVH